jgi:hypothetical protein
MDIERYDWRDHIIHPDWWVIELSVALFAIALLLAASLSDKPIEGDDHKAESASVSSPAMKGPSADGGQSMKNGNTARSPATRSAMQFAQSHLSADQKDNWPEQGGWWVVPQFWSGTIDD